MRLVRALPLLLCVVWLQSTCVLAEKSLGRIEESPTCEAAGDLADSLGTCSGCVLEDCCEEASACAADPGCTEHLACVDASCSADDVFDSSYHALMVCLAGSRCTDCNAPGPAALCEGGLPTTGILGPAACELCVAQNCCDEAKACNEDEVCSAQARCMVDDEKCSTTKTNPACYDQCRGVGTDDLTRAVSGRARQDALVKCAARDCSQSCRAGAVFDCVGEYDWPLPSADKVRLNFKVVQVYDQTTPFEGVTVTACTELKGCSDVAEPAVTDGDGLAELVVPVSGTHAAGFDGYFRFEGAGSSDGDLVPADVFNARVEYRDRIGVDDQPMPSFVEIALGKGLVEVAVDDKLGLVSGAMLDCRAWPEDGLFAHGVVVDLVDRGPSEKIVYVGEGTPAPMPELKMTTRSGAFVAVNVKPGTRVLTFSKPELGEVGRIRVQVSPGDERIVVLGASPSTR